MKIYKLDKEEKELIKSTNRGEWKPVSDRVLKQFKKQFSEIAKNNIKLKNKNKRINIRINEVDLELIKQKAHNTGLPYQTFIGSELHRIAHQ